MRSVNLRRWEAALKLQCVILRSEAPEICWAQSSRAIWNRLDTISIVKMLAEAVQEAKGIAPAEAFETTIDLNVSAYIPDSYISNESLKLDTYKRIAAIENKEEYEDMTEELTDRFGEPPKNVQNLLAVAELKALAHCAYVTELKQMGDSVRVTLQQHAKNRCGADSGAAAEIPRRTEIPDGVAGVCLHAAAEKFKGKDRSAGEEPCTGGRSAADHTGVKYSHNHKIV